MSNVDVKSKVDDYLSHYNEEQIHEKLGYLRPKEFGVVAA